VGDSLAMKSLTILPVPEDWGKPLLLLRQGQQLFAIEVDKLVSEQELVIKPFSNALTAPSYTYGCTILGDGSLIPVINGSVLLDKLLSNVKALNTNSSSMGNITSVTSSDYSSSFNLEESQSSDIASSKSQRISTGFSVSTVLVVDDSAAMRRTLALSLEKSGLRVLQARDGKEALDQLTQASNIALVICDIEMPNMNGFEFLGQRRRFPHMMKIPVAMLTSRSNDKHRKLATHLGADAYFTKPYIEQKFLASIQQMIKK
jgi:chemotaxis family two-component system sensor histidine kinase/response regulator PixL